MLPQALCWDRKFPGKLSWLQRIQIPLSYPWTPTQAVINSIINKLGINILFLVLPQRSSLEWPGWECWRLWDVERDVNPKDFEDLGEFRALGCSSLGC